MSATNWDFCPQCKQLAAAAEAERVKKAEQSYGKVSSAKYLQLLAEASEPIEADETLREDYQIGVDDDCKFYVHYKASCEHCEFHLDFDLETLVAALKVARMAMAVKYNAKECEVIESAIKLVEPDWKA